MALLRMDASPPPVVVVRGRAGIGKTTFAAALAQRACAHGLDVTWATRRSGALPAEPRDHAPAPAQATNDRLLLFDDVDLADAGSLRRLGARVLDSPGTALVMFCRLTRLSAGGPLAGLIDELERARRCRFVTLRALDPGAAAELIQSSLEYRAPVEMSEIVRERTAGDPFLIQELSRALRGQPVEAAARLIPDTVIGLTELRLAALSQPALEATQLSSAFNGAFALDALAAAADLPPQEALAAMRAAEQAGLVQTTDDDQFELVAPLVRDAVRAIAFGGAGREVDRRISEALAVAPSRAEEPVMPILSPQAQDGLTRRQLEVLLLLSEGLTNQEIAERLVVSINTVNRHVSDTYRKIGVSNRVGAAAYAARTGLTSVRESAALVM